MTNAPYLLPQARKGYRLGDAQIVDSMVRDGLWDVYNDYHMGMTGENVADKYRITREEQDEFAVNSHRKAVSAIKECRFTSLPLANLLSCHSGVPVLSARLR